MPIYEYECGKCGVFEHAQRITDAAISKCPTCRRKVRRIISSTSFQLKGSGWYVTDYARSGDSKKDKDKGGTDGDSAKSEATPESKTQSKAEAKAKPDAKSDPKPASKPSSSTTAKAS